MFEKKKRGISNHVEIYKIRLRETLPTFSSNACLDSVPEEMEPRGQEVVTNDYGHQKELGN